MTAFPGTIAFDEYGKPFIILRDQGAQKRLTGADAIKVSFLTKSNAFVVSIVFFVFRSQNGIFGVRWMWLIRGGMIQSENDFI